MAEDEKMSNVTFKTADNEEELKSILEMAQKEKHIVILKVGDTVQDWLDQTSGKEPITMVDCKFAKKDDIEDIFSKCKERIGDKPPLRIETITNFGEPEAIQVISSTPTTLEQLKRLIKLAFDEKLRVMCVRTEHSSASICSDRNNLLIYMKNVESDYKDGFRIRVSTDIHNAVDIMTGVTRAEFKDFQTKTNDKYPANYFLDVVEMVRGASAGCYGTGANVQTPSDCVVQMRIIDSKGNLKTYKSDNITMFKAIQTNLGCFGVVYDMTIKKPPPFVFTVTYQYRKLKQIFYNAYEIEQIFQNNWLVDMVWFPFNSKRCQVAYEPEDDEVWISIMNMDEHFCRDKFFVLDDIFPKKEKERDALPHEPTLMKSPIKAEKPSLTPLISWSDFGIIKEIIHPEKPYRIARSDSTHIHYHRHYIDMAPVYAMEFVFDLKSYSQVRGITEVVVNKVRDYEKKGDYPLNIALEMRTSGYSNALLCPSSIGSPHYNGSGRVLYVDILSVVDTDGWTTFCKDVAHEWMKLGGIPNLSKQWEFIPGIENHISKIMNRQIEEFKVQLKESLCDPEGMFLNKSLQKLFKL